MVVVVAAGNANIDASGRIPAACSGVITVAATDQNGDRSIWDLAKNSASNFGSTVEISAPGTAVLSTLNDGTTVPAQHNYVALNGTSMATPHVAGIVALMLSLNPSLTPNEVLTYLQTYRTGFPAGSTCNTSICGTGIANAAAVLSAINTTPYVYVVNSTADDSDGLCERAPGDCTLREAIVTANGTAAADTIDFVVGGTITLAASLPPITKPLTIWGPSGQSLAIDGANLYRVLKVDTGVTLNLENLTIQNGKSVQGGGIYNNGTLNVLGVTFKGNTAINGGAIYEVTSSVTDISNSTFSGNSATSAGGGIESAGGVLKIINSTFSGNSAPNGAGLLSHTSLYFGNTIIANSSGPDCTNLGALASWDNNLIEGTGASACGIANGSNGSIIGVDPRLGPLASNNGGFTQTMALLSGSQAINAAYNGSCNTKDQTGRIRLPNGGAACDIGAYEVWDTVAPDTTLDTTPANISNSATAGFTFSGTDNFTQPADLTFRCYKDAGPDWTDCSSPLYLTNLSEGTHQFWVYAVDDVGNIDHPDSAYYTWMVDTLAPDISIDSQPADPANTASADFTFSSTDGTATFFCDLDSGGFSACTSPTTYFSLSNGSHTFSVLAADAAGNNSTPASFTWTVNVADTTLPEVTIDSVPLSTTNSTTANFTFSGTDNVTASANLTFECRIDGGSFLACTSPKQFTGLSDGAHVFYIHAIDEAGNASSPDAFYEWQIDTVPPEVSIDSQPADPSNTASADFTFSSTDGSASFACDLDGGGFSACTSPQNYTGLSDGSHTFSVNATDLVGNAGTPVTYTWTVNTGVVDPTPPVVDSIARAYPNPTHAGSVDFTVNFSEPVTGVTTDAFTLTTTGVSGAAVSGISGAGSVYTVTVNTGSGAGTIRLDLNASGTGIQDLAGNPIGAGFTNGAVYNVFITYSVSLPFILR